MIEKWIYQTLIAVLFFVTAMLCLVKAQRNKSKNSQPIGPIVNIMMVFISTLLSIILLLFSSSHKDRFVNLFQDKNQRTNILPWIMAFGTLFFFGNMLFFDALVNAPNAGLPRAIMTTELIFITFMSYWLFDQKISLKQGLGIIFVIIGALLISV